MTSLILQTASRILKPLMLLFSIYLLLSGHNEPGGGFVGGLVAATAFCLNAQAFSPAAARATLHFDPRIIVGVGLLIALASGAGGLLIGEPYLTGQWASVYVPLVGIVKIGTPLLFDVGVYFVVFGFAMMIFLGLMEESHGA